MKCKNCGDEIKKEDKFCEKCGQKVFAETPAAKNIPQKKDEKVQATKPLSPAAFAIVAIVIIVALVIFFVQKNKNLLKLSENPPPVKSTTVVVPSSISNPEYLQNPNNILVDFDGKVTSQEDFNKTIDPLSSRGWKEVWVERILRFERMDHPILLVSYVYSRAGENIISFAEVEFDASPIGDSSCFENSFKNALETLIIGKRAIIKEGFNPYFLYGYDLLLRKQDIPASLMKGIEINSLCIDKKLSYLQKGCFADKSDIVSAQELFVKNGFSSDYRGRYSKDAEVAKMAQRGSWGQCGQ